MIRNFIRLIPYKNFFVNKIKIRYCSTKSGTDAKTPESPSVLPVHKIHLSNFDRRLLVILKYYDSIDKVPRAISAETLGKARSQMRIRVSNILMVLVLIMCFISAWWGKKRAQRGESIAGIMLAREKQILEEYEKEKALKRKE